MHIAGDALTVAVSPENDWVDSMTFDELARSGRRQRYHVVRR